MNVIMAGQVGTVVRLYVAQFANMANVTIQIPVIADLAGLEVGVK